MKKENIKTGLKFLFSFILIFNFFTENLFAEDDDGGYTWSETEYSNEDGWDGTENTPNSPNDDWSGYDWGDDSASESGSESTSASGTESSSENEAGGEFTIYDDDNNVVVSVDYDDAYDENGNFIFSHENEVVEEQVHDHFYDEMISRINAGPESLAKHYSEAVAALEEAKKSGTDEEIAAAQAALDSAKAALDEYCERYNCSWESSGVFVAVFDKEHKTIARAGDPVIVATGKFVIDDSDIFISNGRVSFSLDRHYVSNGCDSSILKNERNSGALGPLWTSNLDTRIIQSWNSFSGEILPELKSYAEKLSEAENIISSYADEDSECEPVLQEIRGKIVENDANIDFYENEAKKCESAQTLNRFVEYGKAASFNGNLPSDILIYCGDFDEIIVFEKSVSSNENENSIENEIYLPASNLWKNKISIEKFPEISSESFEENQSERFVVNFLNSGEKRFYSNYGLPMRFKYENRYSIQFKYDKNFYLSEIFLDSDHYLSFFWNNGFLASVSDGIRKIFYGYEKENLVSVTDFENDTRRFEYDSDGFLKKQIKADGSFISFEYEEIDGEKVISAVTNEEKKSEHFSYDFESRKTVYTNHDGETEIYFYDEKNQTTKIVHSDSSEEIWNFDENGNVKSWSNGSVFANYEYDNSGKIIEKNDEFGATEDFSYSENKLVSHKNKYGIVENYSYDDDGNISAVFVGGKLLKSFLYENRLLQKETDCRGNSFVYSYDEKSNLAKIEILEYEKSALRLFASYEYDEKNRLSKISYQDGFTKKIIYENHKVTIECSNSVKVSKIYSSRKLLLSEEFEDKITGEKFKREYEYDKTGNCRKIFVSGFFNGKAIQKNLLYEYDFTDAGKISHEIIWNILNSEGDEKSGTEIFYSYDSSGNICKIKKRKIGSGVDFLSENEKVTLISAKKTFAGNFVSEICGNAEKSYFFDLRGNLIEQKISETSISKKNYSASGMLISENLGAYGGRNYKYGTDGFLTQVCEENSVKTKNSEISYFPDGKIKESVDSNGNHYSYEYNVFGMLMRVFSQFKKTEYEYDLCGKLISRQVKDEKNLVIYEESWIYSDFGRKVFHKIGGKIVEKLVINGFGMLKSKSDSVENSWIYSYDLLGRKISETNPYGKTSKFFWNENNLLEKIIFPDGNFKRFFYDLNSNLIKAEDSAGKFLEYEYDDLNRVVSSWTRPAAAPEKYEYDDFSRILRITKAGKTLLENSYEDSKMQTVRKDANGNTSFWNFDGEGRLFSSKNCHGNFFENEWNPDGKIKSSTDFSGAKANFSYGKFNLQTSVEYSSGEYFSFECDAYGNLLAAENENSSLFFEYDNAGNLIYQKESETGSETYFKYSDGKISEISCGARKILYEYGKCGEILKIIDNPGSENSSYTIEISFEYDSCGREILRKWSGGESMRIFYDKAGREILRLGFSSSHGIIFAEGCVYDENGFKTLVLESDFSVKKYEYDELGRVKSVLYPYSKEKSGYLKSCMENSNLYFLEGSENFSYGTISVSEYGALQKLCDFAGVSLPSFGMKKLIKESFEYDLNSNLVKRTTPFGSVSYYYDKGDRLVSWGNGCFADYDANGNMISMENGRKIVKMEYNSSNRLKKILINDFENDEQFSAAYEYDALGRRIKSAVHGKGETKISYIGKTQTEFFSIFTPVDSFSSENSSLPAKNAKNESFDRIRYKFKEDDSDKIYDFYDESSALISNFNSEYFTSKSVPLYSFDGEILCFSSESDDSTGNLISFMTGNTGTVKSSVDSADILSQLNYDEFGFPLSGQKSLYGFCGKKFDSKTEFYNFGCRDYSPSFSRFSTEDPVFDGLNWYAYCSGDYVNFFDPNGLEMIVTEAKYMQDMGDVLLGNSSSDKANKEGCVVTEIAESLTAFTGISVDPSFINNDKSNFQGYGGKEDPSLGGLIDWDAIYENYGLAHTAIEVCDLKSINDKASGFSELSAAHASNVWNSDSKEAMSISNYIAGIMESPKNTVVSLQVVYEAQNKNGKNVENLHFVTASGNVTMINGKSYISITPTSIYDLSVGKNSIRGNAGWIQLNGKVYVPANGIRRIDTLSKGN